MSNGKRERFSSVRVAVRDPRRLRQYDNVGYEQGRKRPGVTYKFVGDRWIPVWPEGSAGGTRRSRRNAYGHSVQRGGRRGNRTGRGRSGGRL